MSKFLSLFMLFLVLPSASLRVAGQDKITVQFDPDHQGTTGFSTPEMTAEVIAHSPDPATGQSRSIRVRTGRGDTLVPLPFQFYQVNAVVQGPQGKLLIVGMQAATVYQIGIIDIESAKVIDRFTCYEPAISPDGHYVAFTKFFGPHSSAAPDDHAMIYSVGRSPSQNRPAGVPMDDDINVGFGVYPSAIGNSSGDNISVPRVSAHTISGGYFWQGSQYFFLDRPAGKPQIVWVEVANEAATVSSTAILQSQLGPLRNEFPPRLIGSHLENDKVKLTVYTGATRTVVAGLSGFVRLGSVNLSGPPVGVP